jgi:hypothetical protein
VRRRRDHECGEGEITSAESIAPDSLGVLRSARDRRDCGQGVAQRGNVRSGVPCDTVTLAAPPHRDEPVTNTDDGVEIPLDSVGWRRRSPAR